MNGGRTGFGATMLALFMMAGGAQAAPCTNGGSPITPFDAWFELLSPTYGIDGLWDQPFLFVTQQLLSVETAGCGASCATSTDFGLAACGHLVDDLPDKTTDVRPLGIDPSQGLVPIGWAFSHGSLSPVGHWKLFVQTLLNPAFTPVIDTNQAKAFVHVGTREVFDVASSGGGLQPIQLELRAAGHLGVNLCTVPLMSRIPTHEVHFRVREKRPTGEADFLVDDVQTNFFVHDQVYSLQVHPGSTLYVDVLLSVTAASAAPDADAFGNTCQGAVSTGDFSPGNGPNDWTDGVQILVSPGPNVQLTPRSGLHYTPVPEPIAALPAALVGLAGLAMRRRARGDAERATRGR